MTDGWDAMLIRNAKRYRRHLENLPGRFITRLDHGMVIGPGILQLVRQHLYGLERLALLSSCDKKSDDCRNTSDEISEVLHGLQLLVKVCAFAWYGTQVGCSIRHSRRLQAGQARRDERREQLD